MKGLHNFKVLLWGETPSNPVEAKLLLKMDFFILSFVCLVYWCNYLDRSNLNTAYISGLKEAVGLQGNDITVINAVFTVGYVVGLIPNNLILLKIQANKWMSFCCFAWGMLTLALYKANTFSLLCAIRFFQGVFESCTFTGTHLILASFYNETELTKRSAIFTSSGLLGSMFSSFMQSAIHQSLNGIKGLAGYQWLFIIDFAITIPIALYGFLLFPNTPETCTTKFFNEDELQIMRTRVPKPEHTKVDLSLIKRVLGNWHFWCLSMLWVWFGEIESFSTNLLFGLYLAYFEYSISDRNNFLLGIYAVGIVATFGSALYVDGTGARYHYRVAVLIAVITTISAIMILANPLSQPVAFIAYYLAGASYAGQATFFAWANIICANDLPERAVVLASMNMFSNAVNSWWSILFYGADTAPKFTKGAIAMLCSIVAGLAVAFVTRYLQLRDEKIEKLDSTNEEKSLESNNQSTEKEPVVTMNATEVDSS